MLLTLLWDGKEDHYSLRETIYHISIQNENNEYYCAPTNDLSTEDVHNKLCSIIETLFSIVCQLCTKR